MLGLVSNDDERKELMSAFITFCYLIHNNTLKFRKDSDYSSSAIISVVKLVSSKPLGWYYREESKLNSGKKEI